MNRRNFFAFLPVAPVALIADGAKAETVKHQPRDGEITLSLTATREPKVKRDPHTLYFALAETDPNKKVSLAVGEDSNLWVKSKDGEWKRVVTE